MKKEDAVTTWGGKPLADLTKEELIKVIQELGEEILLLRRIGRGH
jgi:uncharacterized protein